MYSVPWAPSLPHQYNTKSNPHCQWMLNVFVPVFRVIGPISVYFFVHFLQFFISLSGCTLPNDGLHELQENRPSLPDNESVESAIFVFSMFGRTPLPEIRTIRHFQLRICWKSAIYGRFLSKICAFRFYEFRQVSQRYVRSSKKISVIHSHLSAFCGFFMNNRCNLGLLHVNAKEYPLLRFCRRGRYVRQSKTQSALEKSSLE